MDESETLKACIAECTSVPAVRAMLGEDKLAIELEAGCHDIGCL
jgi:hypothetical protein